MHCYELIRCNTNINATRYRDSTEIFSETCQIEPLIINERIPAVCPKNTLEMHPVVIEL